MKKIFLGLLFIGLVQISFAQNETEKIKNSGSKFKISEISVYGGALLNKSILSSSNDIQNLSTNSQLLPKDLSEYKYYSLSDLQSFPSIAIQIAAKLTKNRKLRFGIAYSDGVSTSAYYLKEDVSYLDTLYPTNSAQAVYVDSIYSSHYSISKISQNINLEASYLTSTNPESRFSLYTGLGLSIGISLDTQTRISHTQANYLEYSVASGTYSSIYDNKFDNYNTESEKIKSKANFNASAFVPLGLDFRLSKKSEFWKMIHLFAESRPGLTFTNVPEIGSKQNATFQYGFGFKVAWD